MMVLPLIFISVIAHFPAGLVLYWVTTNLWTVGQGLITRRLVPRTPLGAGGRPEAAPRKPPPDGGAATARARSAPKPKPAPSREAAAAAAAAAPRQAQEGRRAA